jgi:hypothetical protein
MFLRCVTILQNSSTMIEFNSILECMFHIFCGKFYNKQVVSSLKCISDITIDKNIKIYGIYQTEIFNGSIIKTEKNEKSIDFWFLVDCDENEPLKNLQNSSKFFHYYKRLIIGFGHNSERNDQDDCVNKYYNEALFELIEKRLHLSCLWSGDYLKFI